MRTSAPAVPVPASAFRPDRPATPDRADASVISTVRGVPSWGAIVIAVVLTGVGAGVDAVASGSLSWGFRIGFVAGIAVAALAVRRGSIFTAMVQAPLIMVVEMVIALRLMSSERLTFTLIAVVNAFPLMAIGTAVGLLLGLIRILAQPLRSGRSAVTRQHA